MVPCGETQGEKGKWWDHIYDQFHYYARNCKRRASSIYHWENREGERNNLFVSQDTCHQIALSAGRCNQTERSSV